MTYVIGSACIDTMDRSCVEECPVDSIYEGDRKLYIHPLECIDCGACQLACPVEAISSAANTPESDVQHIQDNAAFFTTVLPGREAPVGNPGGAEKVGRIGADTVLVEGQQ